MKICSKCKQKGEFDKHKNTKDGLQQWCKKCKKQWQADNPGKVNEAANRWKVNNPDKVREADRIYQADQRKTNTIFKVKHSNASTFSNFLTGRNGQKSFRHSSYTLQELKKHFENKFYPNPETGEQMTWENYGQGNNNWQTDHWIPVTWSGFDTTNKLHMLVCWSLSNLRPLWTKDNRMKGNTIDILKLENISNMIDNPPEELLAMSKP